VCPSTLFNGGHADFAEPYAALISEEKRYLRDTMDPDGSWEPNWRWDDYPDLHIHRRRLSARTRIRIRGRARGTHSSRSNASCKALVRSRSCPSSNAPMGRTNASRATVTMESTLTAES
jgi:NMD protein affecting ribosome stability and mRNA decay